LNNILDYKIEYIKFIIQYKILKQYYLIEFLYNFKIDLVEKKIVFYRINIITNIIVFYR